MYIKPFEGVLLWLACELRCWPRGGGAVKVGLEFRHGVLHQGSLGTLPGAIILLLVTPRVSKWLNISIFRPDSLGKAPKGTYVKFFSQNSIFSEILRVLLPLIKRQRNKSGFLMRNTLETSP